MRVLVLAVVTAFSLSSAALAQSTDGGSPPREIGNRANGYDYQPTPSEVGPREKAAGIRPPTAEERAINQDLEHMDSDLLRREGLSTKSVPKMND